MQARQLQIAAEYLVMAAWLAYLKSQLLLPPAERELTDAEAMAEDLGERLRRLEALRRGGGGAARAPAARRRSASPRGAPEAPRGAWSRRSGARACAELFGAYGAAMQRGRMVSMTMPARRLMTRGGGAAAPGAAARPGRTGATSLRFLPDDLGDPLLRRSAVAASPDRQPGARPRRARSSCSQAAPFGPIMIRRRP